jgi:hypothetical protein
MFECVLRKLHVQKDNDGNEIDEIAVYRTSMGLPGNQV